MYRPTFLLLLLLSAPVQAQDGLLDRADVASAMRSLESGYQDYLDWQIRISEIPAPPFEEAERAAFLASERAGYITGTVMTIDGGLSSRGKLF